MATELQKCPSCKKKLIDELHDYFLKHHLSPFFVFKCPECQVIFEVNVESIPPFECTIKDQKIDHLGVGNLL